MTMQFNPIWIEHLAIGPLNDVTILSCRSTWIQQCVVNPIVVNTAGKNLKRGGDDKVRHRRHYENQHTGWNRKAAMAKKAKEAEMLADIRRQWRILHGLPVEELSKIVPKVVEILGMDNQLERLATINRGQQLLLQQKYDEHMIAIENYNEQIIQHLLSQIL